MKTPTFTFMPTADNGVCRKCRLEQSVPAEQSAFQLCGPCEQTVYVRKMWPAIKRGPEVSEVVYATLRRMYGRLMPLQRVACD